MRQLDDWTEQEALAHQLYAEIEVYKGRLLTAYNLLINNGIIKNMSFDSFITFSEHEDYAIKNLEIPHGST
tara:strand:- start:49 stop:261 length:213 start_codon:yes stop_codon:yes gene_type:complete